jgi:hypothetical protein
MENKIKKLNGEMKNNSKEKKITIIFGWMGSTHKHLNKYSEIYKELNQNTLQFSPNFNITNHEYYNKFYQELSQILEFENNEIIFHVFSNHGLKYFVSFMDYIEKNKLDFKKQIKGGK